MNFESIPKNLTEAKNSGYVLSKVQHDLFELYTKGKDPNKVIEIIVVPKEELELVVEYAYIHNGAFKFAAGVEVINWPDYKWIEITKFSNKMIIARLLFSGGLDRCIQRPFHNN